MGWQSYSHVVKAATPEEAFHAAMDEVDYMSVPDEGPSGTILEQDGFEVVTLPTLDDLDDAEREKVRYGEAYARIQAFEGRMAAADRARNYVRPNYRSWIADLGDGTMIAFGWAYAG